MIPESERIGPDERARIDAEAAILELNRERRRDVQRATSGFKPERKRYRLKWAEDHELHGLVVEMRGLPVGVFLEMAEMSDLDPTNFSVEDMPKVTRLFEIVAGGLAEWNLLDDYDQPVPATSDGIMAQEFPLVMAIIEGWMEAIGQVPAPLGQPSTDGRLSEVASLPMVTE